MTFSFPFHYFPWYDGKKNELTTRNGRAERTNEENAKVCKAKEFPGVSLRVHFARNHATFYREKKREVICRHQKTPSFFLEKIYACRENIRKYCNEKKKRHAYYKKKYSDSKVFFLFFSLFRTKCNIVSSS
jgi:hypothetical protein